MLFLFRMPTTRKTFNHIYIQTHHYIHNVRTYITVYYFTIYFVSSLKIMEHFDSLCIIVKRTLDEK